MLNGRTKQLMPHYYQFYEDFIANEERLTIKRAVSGLKIPYLIVHGDADTSVLIDEAYQLHQWYNDSTLYVVDGANHVFGARHPWPHDTMPEHLLEASEQMIKFLGTAL